MNAPMTDETAATFDPRYREIEKLSPGSSDTDWQHEDSPLWDRAYDLADLAHRLLVETIRLRRELAEAQRDAQKVA